MIEKTEVNVPAQVPPAKVPLAQVLPAATQKKFEFKKKKSKTKYWIFAGIFLLIIGGGLYFFVVQDSKLEFEDGACEGNTFLGHCFDATSKYFGCDVSNKVCNPDTWEVVLKIGLFIESDIVIYGKSGCVWCERQLEEFGIYAGYLIENGMYVDCEETPIYECSDIKVTPTWKEKGQIVYEGYIPLSDIRMEA